MSDDVIGEYAKQVNEILRSHYPSPLQVSETTCICGYWSENEIAGKTRPVGVRNALDWHKACLISELAKELGL